MRFKIAEGENQDGQRAIKGILCELRSLQGATPAVLEAILGREKGFIVMDIIKNNDKKNK